MDAMSQVVIELPEDVAARLAERAKRDHTTPEEVASEAVESYLSPRRSVGFARIGDSGRSDISENVDSEIRSALGL